MDDQETLDNYATQILSEAVEEFAVNLLEEVFIEDDEGLTLSISQIEHKNELLSLDIGEGVLDEVLGIELPAIAGECFDDIIAEHRLDLDSVQRVNGLLRAGIQEMAEDIVLDVIGQKLSQKECEYILDSILSDVVNEECNSISKKLLDHYHMRVALSQYKQIQTSASGFLMDKLLLDSLLSPHDEASKNTAPDGKAFPILAKESDMVLNNIVLDVLLAQTLALHSCFPKNLPTKVFKNVHSLKLQPVECLPLNWYKDKLVTSIAEDVVVTMLCDRLDESMQFVAQEHMKNEAVSLVTRLVEN